MGKFKGTSTQLIVSALARASSGTIAGVPTAAEVSERIRHFRHACDLPWVAEAHISSAVSAWPCFSQAGFGPPFVATSMSAPLSC